MDILIKIAQLFLCFTILVGIHELLSLIHI